MNDATSRLLTASKCIALVVKQINNMIYDLLVFLPRPRLTNIVIGSAKSTPVVKKARFGTMRSAVIVPLTATTPLSRKQALQLYTIFFAMFFPPISFAN